MTEATALPTAEGIEAGSRRRWKPYPAYADSGVEWLGEVPQEWDVHALKYGYSVCLGKMLQSEPSSARDMYVPYLRAANVLWEGVDISDVKEMWFSPEEKASCRLEPGDLVVCEGGETGRCALWEGELPECYIQNAVQRVRARPGYSSRFLYYWLHALKHNGYIDVLCSRATIAHLTAVKLGNLPVLQPPDTDCDAILSFLDRGTTKLDALIAKKERLIELLQEKRTALVTQAVTKGLDSTVPMKDSGIEWLGEIPAHWEVKRLSHLLDPAVRLVYGILLPGPKLDDGVPYIEANHVVSERLRLDALPRTTQAISDEYQRSIIRAGELVYAIRGSFGNVEAVPQELDGVNLSRDCARIAPAKGVSPRWLCYALKSQASQEQFRYREVGTAVTGVNIRDLKRTVIVVPPPSEQKAISAFLDHATTRLNSLTVRVRDGIEQLREYRTALISAAVTGKIDVRGDATL